MTHLSVRVLRCRPINAASDPTDLHGMNVLKRDALGHVQSEPRLHQQLGLRLTNQHGYYPGPTRPCEEIRQICAPPEGRS